MKRMKQFTSLILSVVLVLTAPGLDFYRAFAQAPVKAQTGRGNFSQSGTFVSGVSANAFSVSGSQIQDFRLLNGGILGASKIFEWPASVTGVVSPGDSKTAVSKSQEVLLLESQEAPQAQSETYASSLEADWTKSQVRFDGSLSRSGQVLEADAVRADQGVSSGISSRGPPSASQSAGSALEIAAPASADSVQAVSQSSSWLKPVLAVGLAAALLGIVPDVYAQTAQALNSSPFFSGAISTIDGGFRVSLDLFERHFAFNLAFPGLQEQMEKAYSVVSHPFYVFSLDGLMGEMSAIFFNAKDGSRILITPSSLGYAEGNIFGFIFALPLLAATLLDQGARDMKTITLKLGVGASNGLYFVGVIVKDLFWAAQNFFGGAVWLGAYKLKLWFDALKNAPSGFSAWKRKLLLTIHSHPVAMTWLAAPLAMGSLTYLFCYVGLKVLAPNAPAFLTDKIFLFFVQSAAAFVFGYLFYPSVAGMRENKSAEGNSPMTYVLFSVSSLGFAIWAFEQFMIDANGWDALRHLFYIGTNTFVTFNSGEGAYLAWKYRGNSSGAPKELDLKDSETAELLKRAGKGEAEAQFQLARKYEDLAGASLNEKTHKSHAAALEWLQKAAGQDYVPAQLRLADKYLFGYGVKQDPVEAYKWYVVSAVRSRYENTLALKMMDYLRGKLTQEQIGQAIDRAHAQSSSDGAGPSFGRVVLED